MQLGRFHFLHFIPTVVFFAAAAVPGQAYGLNFADEFGRETLRLGNSSGRGAAAQLSDVLLTTLTAFPLLVDVRASARAGWKANGPLVRDSTILLFATGVTAGVKLGVARDRPYVVDCSSDPGLAAECLSSDSHRSFFSGHSAVTFASAGLTCRKTAAGELPSLACPSAMGLAATTALLRVMADKHFVTDVLVGSAFGVFSGFYLSQLLFPANGDGPVSMAIRSDGRSHFALDGVMRF